MTNERLKEIKDNIDCRVTGAKLQALKHAEATFNEELELYNEVIRLKKIIEDIDTYIHLWKSNEISEKTILILNDILLIKNNMQNEVVRLKENNK